MATQHIRSWAVLGLLLWLPALPVLAHSDHGQAGGFLAGLLHPVGGLDHVLAMLAVGLWGAQLGSSALWVLPVAFPMVMAVGGFLALIGIPLPGVELELDALARLPYPPLLAAAVIVALFAIFHGHAHGVELPAGADGLAYSIGFVVSTGLLHAAGIVLGLLQRLPHGQQAIRGMGAAIGLGGVYFLGSVMAG